MTRIGGTARALAATLVLAAATGVHAQTFSRFGYLDPACGGDESVTVSTGCVEEERSLGGQCVICNQIAADSMTSWSRTAARGSLTARAHVEGMQYIAAPCGSDSGGTARIDQTVRGDDVTFTRISNPNATGEVNVSLNVEFRGHVEALPACIAAYAIVDVCTQMNMYSCMSFGRLSTGGNSGSLASYPNDMSTLAFTGNLRTVYLGVPSFVILDLKVKTADRQCESADLRPADSTAIGELTLPTSGPVFVLPPDVTVNSAQLGIVNNQWVGAAPAVTDPPDPQSVCEGSRADFSVAATGGASLQYQWRSNGVDLADGPTGTGSTIVGATTAALIVFDVAGADTGSVDCVVSNGCLGTTSAAAALALTPAAAEAGADQGRDELVLVTLDGSGSTGLGCASPSATWSQIAGTAVTLDTNDPLHPTFVAPEVGPGGEQLTFRLDIDDGAGGAVSDFVVVTIVNVSGDVDADGVQDVADCAPFDPMAFAVPGEVAGVSFAADDQTVAWDSVAPAAGSGSVYDAMRGNLDELPVGSGAFETCLASGIASLQASDATVPASGAAFYYLVRARNACGVGSYGASTGGAERTNSICP